VPWRVPPAADLLSGVIAGWVADPDSDVVYSEWVDGRWAVRMRQTVREATTVWWEAGERSVRAEAYLFPAPERQTEAVYRLCLARNGSAWRSRLALDAHSDIVIRARIANQHVSVSELEWTLGEIYEMVELTFPGLVRLQRMD
jgi:hypothetical protein